MMNKPIVVGSLLVIALAGLVAGRTSSKFLIDSESRMKPGRSDAYNGSGRQDD